MSETEDIFRKLKKEVENTAAEAQRAKGALDQLNEQLLKEFKCSDLKEATALLAKLEAQADKAKEQFERQLRDYEKKWKGDK